MRVSGAKIQATLMDALKRGGWLRAHFKSVLVSHPGRVSYMALPMVGDKGVPDIIAVHVRTGRVLFLEVKGDGDTVKPEQQAWLDALNVGASGTSFIVAGVATKHNLQEWVDRLCSP